MSLEPNRAVPRREFVRSAVAIGGASALSACLDAETDEDVADPGEPKFPQGREDLSALPERQHAWNDFMVREPSGDTILPQQQLLLFVEYTGSIPPTDDERAAVEDTLRSVERAYQRGTGGTAGATFLEGLLFLIGYAPGYFDRFDADLPPGIDLPNPATVIKRLEEDATPESADAVIVLNSDYGSVLLGVEEALFDDVDRLNGVTVKGDFSSVFEKVERRPAVVGRGNPAKELDHDAIDEDAPMSMGYKSGFDDSNPEESRVTWDDGPFSGGTTLLASRLGIDLDSWYEFDEETRVGQMFTMDHTPEDIGRTGEALGADSGITEESVENLEKHAREHGCVGHSAKAARARDDDFEPLILRRSEGNISDPAHDAGMNFTSLQSGIEDFIETRNAMDDFADVEAHKSGIVDFLTTERRGTYLVPPRSLRALPSPRPDEQ
ncbi:hypothetical protein ACLI4U_10825 [Natrialbaceae archaeon A-CW2]|uniref:DUF7405 family protein n=1 Tax=Natronosalvus amylolyticus TaxID=2961994 RepID=UPI0020C9BDD7|nr:Tat pathway signal protein [Natronosalvus amylolyticus]